jgi:Fe-S-cluster formation regulator IscX/YfhJ
VEPFENAGVWWLPGQEEQKIVGILRFDPADGFRLEIPFGGLGELDDFAGRINTSVRTPLVHGLLRNGKSVTLVNAVMTNSSINFPGGRREEHRALRGFIGQSLCDENPTVDRLRIRYSHLRDWVVVHPAGMTMRFEDERPTGGVEYRYEPIEQSELSQGDGWRLTLSHTARHPFPSVTGFNVAHDCLLTLELAGARGLDSVDEQFLNPLWQFFSFCLDAGVDVSLLEMHLVDVDKWLEVGRAQTVTREPDKVILQDYMLLSMPELGERLAHVLMQWMRMDGDLRRAVSLMVGLGSERSVPSDLRFVAAAQALEAVSRVGVDDRDLPREEFRRRRAVIRDSIPDKVVRDWACDRLTFNRRSADDLLRDLLTRIGGFAEELAPDADRFLRDHRDNRNFYAHRADQERPLLEPGELYVHTQGVLLLLKAATLLMLGYSSDEIVAIMRGCQNCIQWAGRVAEMYAVLPDGEPA